MCHAAMMAGATCAGIYWTSAPPEVEFIILGHCRTPLLLLEDAGQMAKIAGRREALPALRTIVAMRGDAVSGATTWDEFLGTGR